MLLAGRVQSVELIVGENANGSQGGKTAIPVVFLYLHTFLLKSTTVPAVRYRFARCPLSERDDGRLTPNVGRQNAREARGFQGLDDQPIYQNFPPSPPV